MKPTRFVKVDDLLQSPELKAWRDRIKPSVQTAILRRLMDDIRKDLKKSSGKEIDFKKEALARFEELQRPSITKAINATGVVLHTNLGRAPLERATLDAMAETLSGYCTLEIDSMKGTRGSRAQRVSELIALLTGAECALIVNNNAAAVWLVLKALFSGKKVIVSRSEIVQIGGGFRIHEILEESGAIMVEVGTTNIAKLKDFEKKIQEDIGCFLKVHQSDFVISGHTDSPSMSALSDLARKYKIPFVVDLGSGGLHQRPEGDPSIENVLRSGADIVCFSADKLFGSSQAGIIVGSQSLLQKIQASPLYRTLRVSKLDLFLLERTLEKHIAGKGTSVDSLIEEPIEKIEERAKRFSKELERMGLRASVISGKSSIGGGTTPQDELETFLVELPVEDSEKSFRRLTQRTPAIFVRKGKKKISIDLRTVFPNEERDLIEGIRCLF